VSNASSILDGSDLALSTDVSSPWGGHPSPLLANFGEMLTLSDGEAAALLAQNAENMADVFADDNVDDVKLLEDINIDFSPSDLMLDQISDEERKQLLFPELQHQQQQQQPQQMDPFAQQPQQQQQQQTSMFPAWDAAMVSLPEIHDVPMDTGAFEPQNQKITVSHV
jgi:hypothetical protein